MSIHTHPYPATPVTGLNARALGTQPAGTLLRALGSVSGALCLHAAGTVHTAWYRYTSRNELQELDARTLQDIGLSKDEVDAESQKWFWQY